MSHIIVNALWPSSLPDAYITSVGILPQPQCRMGGCTSSACKSFCSMWISWIHIVVICLLPTSPHLLSFQSPFFFLLLLFHFFTLFLSIFDLSPCPFRPIWIKSLPSKKDHFVYGNDWLGLYFSACLACRRTWVSFQHYKRQLQWTTLVIIALRKHRQEEQKFQIILSLGFMRPFLRKKRTK